MLYKMFTVRWICSNSKLNISFFPKVQVKICSPRYVNTTNAINGRCVGVSIETVLQIDKFYTVVRRIFELTFRTVFLRLSECTVNTTV